jgi:hypothetical protein
MRSRRRRKQSTRSSLPLAAPLEGSSRKGLKWYNTFLAAPTQSQQAYYDECWWKSDWAALEDISHVRHVFGDFATTRLSNLKYRALVKDGPWCLMIMAVRGK